MERAAPRPPAAGDNKSNAALSKPADFPNLLLLRLRVQKLGWGKQQKRKFVCQREEWWARVSCPFPALMPSSLPAQEEGGGAEVRRGQVKVGTTH